MLGYFRKTAILPLMFLLSSLLWANPEDSSPYTVENDGALLTLRDVGDERYRFSQTLDGYLLIEDAQGVFY